MRKSILSVVICSLVFIFLVIQPKKAEATHAAATELSYRWVQDSTYQITLVFYRNCQGFTAGAPTVFTANVSSSSTNRSMTVSLSQLPTYGTGVPPLSPPGMMNCYSGQYCFEEYVYRGNWTSPERADDWIISASLCCLPVTIAPANMTNGTLYNECMLNNLDFPDTRNKNISPLFHNRRPNIPGFLTDTVIKYPNISMCEGGKQILDESVRNYDGDRIKYEFFVPQTANGAANTYINGYSFGNPMPTTSGPLTIDSTNGVMQFTPGSPTGTGIYLVGIQATEFRNDTISSGPNPVIVEKPIGFVKRTLFIAVTDSANCPDSVPQVTDSTNTSLAVSSIDIRCQNNPISFGLTAGVKCHSVDPDASNILLLNATTNDTIKLDSLAGDRCGVAQETDLLRLWLDSILPAGTYNMMFVPGKDGNTLLGECGYEIPPLVDTIVINVYQPGHTQITADTATTSDTLELECGLEEFEVYTTNPIFCSSADNSGSDFLVQEVNGTKTVGIHLVKQLNCNNHNQTQHLKIKLDSALAEGIYRVTVVTGNDGNSLLDPCYNNIDSSSIILKVNGVPQVSLGPDFQYCVDDPGWDTVLYVPTFYHSYLWSTNSRKAFSRIVTGGTYWVEVQNEFGCKSTDTLLISGKVCFSGINEWHIEEISIYPNPNSGILHLDIPDLIEPCILSITSIQGKTVLQEQILQSKSKFNLSSLQDGVYILEVKAGKRNVYRNKLVLN